MKYLDKFSFPNIWESIDGNIKENYPDKFVILHDPELSYFDIDAEEDIGIYSGNTLEIHVFDTKEEMLKHLDTLRHT